MSSAALATLVEKVPFVTTRRVIKKVTASPEDFYQASQAAGKKRKHVNITPLKNLLKLFF